MSFSLPDYGSRPATSRSKPYSDASRQPTQATPPHFGPPPPRSTNQNPPPATLLLGVGQDSMLDIMRECVQTRFPDFVPRNSADILSLAGIMYDGPMDQASICAYLDKMHAPLIPFSMEKHGCSSAEEALAHLSASTNRLLGGRPASDAIGVKPRPGQKTWLRIMPAWPEYSIRLWLSSPSVKLFGMDFVLSATNEPINLSTRFQLRTTAAWGCGPDGTLELEPFEKQMQAQLPPGMHPGYYAPPGPPAPGSELYMLPEEQTIFIQDRMQPGLQEVPDVNLPEGAEPLVTLLRFDVPKYPVDTPGQQLRPGFQFDELHWDLKE